MSAKWAWLAAEAGPGTHVLRLSYGRQEGAARANAARFSEAQTDRPRTDTDLLAQALADASALLEIPMTEADVVGWDVVRWPGTLPFAALGHQQRVAAVRDAVRGHAGLGLVGGWLAGNGLVAVVTDAKNQAEQLLGQHASEPGGRAQPR
jgi:oxygen-dependent protoporphyrinogen oxidase